jgi:hypothetical protein
MASSPNEQRSLRAHEVQYHVAEYASLHGEIRELIAEARTLERQVLFATGAVWAWLAIHGKDVPQLAWYIPVLFAVAGAIRAFALKRAVENIALYIRRLEGALSAGPPNLVGWKTFRRLMPPAEEFVTSGVMWSAWFFWVLLILATVVIPVFVLLRLSN